jgi:hypothetical protein
MNDYVIIWEPPPMNKPEFRLYYDDHGRVLFYTCEKPEGNYIVINAQTYAEGRPDIRIVDGKISTVTPGAVISKLVPSSTNDDEFSLENTDIECAEEDVSIIVEKRHKVNKIQWKLKTYELR